ncbi:MAG: HDOD domain-containing protein [Rhodocyclaceae bacterium]|nr:HDOD domain-containing protein [Rhodocyclaceae bacterium]
MIETPFTDTDAWMLFYSEVELPVLRRTVRELDELRAIAEKVNGRVLASIILQDPLMTLRVLAYIEERRRKSQTADITTIERALMMIGIDPFFAHFSQLPTIEDHLKGHSEALLGLLKVIHRARRAAYWSRDWAILRHDLDVDEITVATLLHDAAEMLMWCFAPNLAIQARNMQTRNRALRSTYVQEQVYNTRLADLHTALVKVWHLPELLTHLMIRTDNPRVKNVTLAVDLARHSANGWNDAALPDDFTAIEELLHLSPEALKHRLDIPEQPPTETHPASQTPQ